MVIGRRLGARRYFATVGAAPKQSEFFPALVTAVPVAPSCQSATDSTLPGDDAATPQRGYTADRGGEALRWRSEVARTAGVARARLHQRQVRRFAAAVTRRLVSGMPGKRLPRPWLQGRVRALCAGAVRDGARSLLRSHASLQHPSAAQARVTVQPQALACRRRPTPAVPYHLSRSARHKQAAEEGSNEMARCQKKV